MLLEHIRQDGTDLSVVSTRRKDWGISRWHPLIHVKNSLVFVFVEVTVRFIIASLLAMAATSASAAYGVDIAILCRFYGDFAENYLKY